MNVQPSPNNTLESGGYIYIFSLIPSLPYLFNNPWVEIISLYSYVFNSYVFCANKLTLNITFKGELRSIPNYQMPCI